MPRPRKLAEGNNYTRPEQRETITKLQNFAETQSGLQPTVPKVLKGYGKEAYTRVFKILNEQGLVTNADFYLVVSLAMNIQILFESYKSLNENGVMYLNTKGDLTKNPATTAVDSSSKTIKSICNDLGMTPSSRANLLAGVEDDATATKAEMKEMFGG